MDYNRYFSDDVPSFMRSPVREIFRKVDLSAIFSFAGGYPDAATFPTEDIKRLSALVLEKYGSKALQYGATQGVTELREVIAKRYSVPVENVQITTSSQQGIDVCTRILCNPGDTILTTAPTYLGALQSFRSYRANVVTLPDVCGGAVSAGRDTLGESKESEIFAESQKFPTSFDPTAEAVPRQAGEISPYCPPGDILPFRARRGRQAPEGVSSGSATPPDVQCCQGTQEWAGRQQNQPFLTPGHPRVGGPAAKFCYVIPDFQNPSGVTMTLQERERLVAMAREGDSIIVEDSPYRELRYSGTPVPTIYSLAPERTLHLGSFSKIFAPGFRLGWIIGPQPLLEQIFVCKQALDLCPPVFDQYMAAEFMGSGALDANLQKSIELYRTKRDLMLSLLEKYMPEGVSWTHPEGGLFLFLTLPEHIDTVALYDRALAAGVAYVAGSFFYPDGSHRNTMRLNFSYLDSSRMEPGLRLLAEIVRDIT